MKVFEYQVKVFPTESFKALAYYCTSDGQCEEQEVPADQPEVLTALLNAQGERGWDLVQLAFGKDNLVSVWRRERP